MERWEISNQEIESTEKLLLPENAHFPEDARDVIRCWHSVDVSACPGSGKTTVLLAKLKLLADRMPLKNGAGICVLSHTNVAVKEIKNRLSGYADKLIAYPNYIGTIQSFIDKFVTMPYLRNITGHNVQVIDDLPYVRQMLKRIYDEKKYEKLKYVIRNSYLSNKQFADIQTFVQALYLRDDGSLCVGNQKKALAGAGKPSTQQFNILIEDLLMKDGIIRFHDAYSYAQKAIDTLSETYTDLFPLRFRYVFIDEYQDCDIIQRKALMKIFDSEKCSVMNIGDPDQAIYNSSNSKVPDWDPRDGFLPIQTSYEKFVLEYFKRHHSYLSEVRAAQVKWNLATDTEESMIRFLPAMQTDIFLRYKEKVLIIDTKYYGNSMQKQYDKVTIHSGNMYQIFTYVKNQDVENNGRVSGMLLYAKTEEAITPDCSFVIGGNKISVKTVDLNKEFKLIAAQLDKIAEDYFGKKRIEDSII